MHLAPKTNENSNVEALFCFTCGGCKGCEGCYGCDGSGQYTPEP